MAPIEPNKLLPIGSSPSILGTRKGLLLLLRPGKEGRPGRLFQRLSRNPPLSGAPKGREPPGGAPPGGGGGGAPFSIKSSMFGGAGGGPKPVISPPSGPSGPWLLLLLTKLSLPTPLNLSSLFFISNSLPGWLGKDFIKSLSGPFFFKSISLNRLPTTGFSESKVEMSSKTSSRGFCLLIMFLLMGSSFCLKLASLILSLVT